jgi:uncharacterized Zn-binding protein involved in type VI secretion
MANFACVLGSPDSGGGSTLAPVSNNVNIGGQPAAMVGSHQSSHPNSPPHYNATIVSGSSSVFVNGIPLAITNVSSCSCGHVLTGGVASVQVGN